MVKINVYDIKNNYRYMCATCSFADTDEHGIKNYCEHYKNKEIVKIYE